MTVYRNNLSNNVLLYAHTPPSFSNSSHRQSAAVRGPGSGVSRCVLQHAVLNRERED